MIVQDFCKITCQGLHFVHFHSELRLFLIILFIFSLFSFDSSSADQISSVLFRFPDNFKLEEEADDRAGNTGERKKIVLLGSSGVSSVKSDKLLCLPHCNE